MTELRTEKLQAGTLPLCPACPHQPGRFPLPLMPSPHRGGVVWAGGTGGGCAAELLLTSQDAIVRLGGFAASLSPQQSVLLSSHIYIDPPPSTAGLLPLSILLLFITWEGRLWKWQIRAAAGEAVWQGRKGLSAAALPHLVGTSVLSLLPSLCLSAPGVVGA